METNVTNIEESCEILGKRQNLGTNRRNSVVRTPRNNTNKRKVVEIQWRYFVLCFLRK